MVTTRKRSARGGARSNARRPAAPLPSFGNLPREMTNLIASKLNRNSRGALRQTRSNYRNGGRRIACEDALWTNGGLRVTMGGTVDGARYAVLANIYVPGFKGSITVRRGGVAGYHAIIGVKMTRHGIRIDNTNGLWNRLPPGVARDILACLVRSIRRYRQELAQAGHRFVATAPTTVAHVDHALQNLTYEDRNGVVHIL